MKQWLKERIAFLEARLADPAMVRDSNHAIAIGGQLTAFKAALDYHNKHKRNGAESKMRYKIRKLRSNILFSDKCGPNDIFRQAQRLKWGSQIEILAEVLMELGKVRTK